MTAVILAGGRSTRFGSDKGLVKWRGRRLVDHVRNVTFLVETGNDDGKMHGKRA